MPHSADRQFSRSRRRFLGSIAATTVMARPWPAAAHGAIRGAGESAAGHLKVGAVTYNIAKDWNVDTIIRNFTAAGIEAVELRTTHAHGVEIALPPAARREVKARFEASPVRLASLGTTCEYHAADPAVVARQVDETKAWLQLARDVGAASIKVRPNGLRKDVTEEQSLEQIGRALAECSRAAATHPSKARSVPLKYFSTRPPSHDASPSSA